MALSYRQIKTINSRMDVPSLLGALGFTIYRLPQTMRCPFHDDTSKSAKVFPDGRIYCWTEQKMFGAYDLLKLLGYTDNQMLRLLSEIGAAEAEEAKPFVPDIEASKRLIAQFRMGKMEFPEYIERVYELYGSFKKG